jgi:hypothetical protein
MLRWAMRSNPGSSAIAVALAISACAPGVDGPLDHQRAIDRDDSERLAAQLAQLPGVASASVILHRAVRDPLSVAAPTPTTFTAVIGIDDRADARALQASAERLARASLPELAPGAALPIEIHTTVHRPSLAKVGPFSVEDTSRTALRITLAVACLAIAGLAAALARSTHARRHRRDISPQ